MILKQPRQKKLPAKNKFKMRLLSTFNFKLSTCLSAGKTRNKGFTLIEILVVVAIIGVLAGIAILMLDRAQSKSRDARRVADVETISIAFRFYYQAKGTYKIDGTGYCSGSNCTTSPPNGNGWFNFDGSGYGATSIAQGLVNAGYVSSIIIDPSRYIKCSNSTDCLNKYPYMFYYSDFYKMASAFAHLENPTSAQTATYTSSLNALHPCGSSPCFPNVKSDYLMNYASTITN